MKKIIKAIIAINMSWVVVTTIWGDVTSTSPVQTPQFTSQTLASPAQGSVTPSGASNTTQSASTTSSLVAQGLSGLQLTQATQSAQPMVSAPQQAQPTTEQLASTETQPVVPAYDQSGQVITPPEPQDNSANAFGNTPNSRAAFGIMVRNLMPLSQQQILTLRQMFDQSQAAVSEYPGVPPKPTSSSILVNMSPGATPPIIRLRAGYVTTLVFLDSTGQPWPVVGYDLGNTKAFNIVPTAPDGKGNMLVVQALYRYEEGNLAIMLKDENTPVMLTLIPGQRAVDYRVDLRIPGLGPNAVAGVAGLPQTENPMLLSFLDGVTPGGAKPLDVAGAPAQAWAFDGKLFLRTRVTVLSPGWISSMNSPDGTHVYELEKTPVILASQRGEMVQLSIRGL